MYRLRNAITRAISSVRPVSRQQLPTPKQVPPARQFAAATTTNNTNTTKDNNSSNNNDHSKNNNMANRADSIFELAKARRSYYPLSKELTISPERVQEIVKQGILHVPSSFNSQSNRAIVLFGADHEKLWDIATEAVKPFVPPEGWQSTANRMAMFKAAAGSVLFFEDQTVVETFQEKFALYADRFPGWALQSDAMLQFLTWTALEAEGLGANLQHYNPLIDAKVAETWGVPSTWKLNAQLVFGGKTGDAGEKTYQPLEERFKVFGA